MFILLNRAVGGTIMKAVGVIVEYNPFHNGHAYHLHAAKEQLKPI